jgi:hypothetical protein
MVWFYWAINVVQIMGLFLVGSNHIGELQYGVNPSNTIAAVIDVLFSVIVLLSDQLIKPVEIKRNISTKIEWNPFPLSITRTLIGRVPNISGTLPKKFANTGTKEVLVRPI